MTTSKMMDEGKYKFLDILFGDEPVESVLYVGLYKNVTEPLTSDTLTDLAEVSGYGYARQALNRGSWALVDNEVTYEETTFLASGGDWGDVYGSFITDVISGVGGNLIAVEHLDAPYTIVDGKGIKIVPKFTIP